MERTPANKPNRSRSPRISFARLGAVAALATVGAACFVSAVQETMELKEAGSVVQISTYLKHVEPIMTDMSVAAMTVGGAVGVAISRPPRP